MQEEKACLCRDREADLVSHFKTAASLEMLFGQTNLNMTKQLDQIGGWKSPNARNISVASARLFPFSFIVIKEAEAWLMAQPCPVNLISCKPPSVSNFTPR